jgi:rfaE bifunctional protein nucleotidyltransferase chain/domain
VVHCHGVFDLLHIGHIRYLQKARELGDLLVVTLTADRYVNKGPHRPAFPEQLRASALAALDCVDCVAVSDRPTATEAILELKPHIYAKGAEFRKQMTPELEREQQAAASVGTAVEFIEEITSSSSQLINQHLGLFSDDLQGYLDALKKDLPADEILKQLERARSLKVLVIGEAIIDEHYACETLGRSMKAPIVAARYQSHERYAGGAVAVANHVAGFCDDVGLISMLGADSPDNAWIESEVDAAVHPSFVYKSGAPTIVKRRYRESYFGIPLFEINHVNDDPLTSENDRSFRDAIQDKIDEYDAVLVADYGHSMLGRAARELICERARYVCVSPQVNAANVGYQSITKYPRADLVVLAQQELELECRDRSGDFADLARQLADLVDVGTICVTLGKRGCLCYNRSGGLHEAPALTTKVVDRTGAPDAFFAVASLAAVLNLPLELLAFLGNVAGAEAVSVVGNSQHLQSLPFTRHIQSLLK